MQQNSTSQKICNECKKEFLILSSEFEIGEKVFAPDFPIPETKKCPNCRMRQRLAFRNERKLYRIECALSGKPIISLYRPNTSFLVYDQSMWWSDKYDPLAYGQEFDFTRTFFSQFAELHRRVPKLSIHNSKSENCDYTNYSSENRNCYLVVGGLGAEDCLYSYRVFYSRNVVDSFGLSRSELCYQCSQGTELYNCVYATNCQNCSNLFLCHDCVGCRDCFGCVNLRNKQYYIYNQQYNAEEYESKVTHLRKDLLSSQEKLSSLIKEVLPRSSYTTNSEDSSGDQIRNCRRCQDVFFMYDSEDVIHARNGDNNRDCVDINFGDNCELQYQASNLEKNYRVAFAALAWYVSESFYVLSCFNSKKLFGCCGMKKNEYCILNKQYSPSEYEVMLKKIVAHMCQTGEWGAFFPASISPFLFNETVAAELFPLSDAEILSRGFNAGLLPARPETQQQGDLFPCCKICKRNFRIIPQETKFYREMNLESPEICPDCRHEQRIKQRRPLQLRLTSCINCKKNISTSTQDGLVLCEECFINQEAEIR